MNSNTSEDKKMIRYVEDKDRAVWNLLDRHLPASGFDEKVRTKQGYVYVKDDEIIGVLRYNLFWDNTPFCTMLYIADKYRGKGYGKQLMEHWELEMRAKGYGMVMTSTQVDEEAQYFYRKLGYKDAGGFTIDVPGYAQPEELIMIKALA